MKKQPSRPKHRGLPRPSPGLLASALGSLGEGALVADRRLTPDGLRIRFVNDSLCAMLGRSLKDLNGLPHCKIHDDRDHFSELRKWLARLQPGSSLHGEGYLACAGGQRLYTTWTFSPVVGARGLVTHISIIYRDMTAKRRLQEDLAHAQRLDAVGRLAGGVAHDFNNLLSIINGYCEILRGSPAVMRLATREIAEIHRAGLHATGLVRQLLAFSRRQALDLKVVSLNQLVQENSDILSKLLLPDKTLDLDLAANFDHARVDPLQLQQVLLNLVINARDALAPGGRVTLRTDSHEVLPGQNRRTTDMPPGRYVLLSVTDDGAGMDAATRAHLFEPFFTTKPEGKGTGLGLSLVYGIVQQSGGHIFVRSTLGAGTTFDIFLPAVHEPLSPRSSAAPAPLPSTRGNETILLVQDDPVVAKMTSGILASDGYRVLSAPSPAKARPLALRTAPALLVLDPGRTGPSGAKLIRDLHAAHPSLRLLLTGGEDTALLPDFPPRLQAVLPKPHTLSALLHALRTLLDTPAAP